MISLVGRLAPDFKLSTLDGHSIALSDWRGRVVVVNFWSAECPWSRRADVLLVYRQLTWEPKGVRIVGIASNANEPEAEIRHEIENRHLTYPVVIDYEHRVADLYRAETTPHFFVTDPEGMIRYMGALDDSTFKQRDAKNLYVDGAVSALLENRMPDPPVTSPYGCAIVRQAPDSTALTTT